MSLEANKQNINFSASYEVPHNLPVYYYKHLKDFMDPLISKLTSDFWGIHAESYLVAITETPLYFWKENDYFVTQIELVQNAFVQLRISNTATGIFLEESLGKSQSTDKYFKFTSLTKLESEFITNYSQTFLKKLKGMFLEPRKIKIEKEPNKNLLHLTLLINTPQRIANNSPAGKVIVSLPFHTLKQPKPIEHEFPVNLAKYYHSYSETNVFIGTAIISLEDLKKLGVNDVIILDNTNLKRMRVYDDNNNVEFKVAPDQNLVLNIYSEDYNTMNQGTLNNKNIGSGEAIWDNILVEVAAEFKKIKLPLGEIKNMTEGLVVEVAALSKNEVRLHIDGKDLALGELVIVGDKYGVMIQKVLYKKTDDEPDLSDEEETENEENDEESDEKEDSDSEEDFYDDLGIEDEFLER